MALFDGDGGGLMQMYSNPQMAGLLGMSQGLLSAAGPSRLPVSMGQALGAGMGQMQQGIGNAFATRMQMAKLQSLMDPFGGGLGAPQQPSAPQGAPVTGDANTGPMSGPSAGLGQFAGYGGAPAGSSGAGASGGNGPLIMGHSPQEWVAAGYRASALGNPAGTEMIKLGTSFMTPTDSMKLAGAAFGVGTPAYNQALQNQVENAGAMSIRPGGGIARGNQISMIPQAVPGFVAVQDPNNPAGWTQVPIGNGANAITASESAKELGKAQNENQQVWDPSANGGQGGFVFQTRANVNASANGGNVPIGIRNNNFGNIRGADGQFATYDTPQAGVNAADQTLAAYGAKHGINTIAGIANRWAPAGDGNNNPAQKAAAMAAASGVPANQPINLADPATRARILPALFDTETPGWRNALQGTIAPQAPHASGPMAAQPPLGQANAANAAQGAPSKQMADAYNALSSADTNYQASRAALQSMLDITNKNAPGDTLARLLPQEWATRLSNDAAEYEKAHALYTSLQGKALGSGGTDASRANQGAAVPDFTKPQGAKLQGLTAQLQQLDMNHLKTQFLTPIYQQGNEKQFTQQNAAFDQNITPSMVPMLTMPAGPQRAQALQQAIKADPSIKPRLDWAVQNGLLK